MKKKFIAAVALSFFLFASCTNPSASSGPVSSSESSSATSVSTVTPSSISSISVSSQAPVPSSVSSSEETLKTISVSDFKKLEKGVKGNVKGIVTKVLNRQNDGGLAYAWITDGDQGIAVYPSKGQSLEFTEGEEVVISGNFSVYNGLPEITDPEIVSHKASATDLKTFSKGVKSVSDILGMEVTDDNVGLIYTVPAKITKGNHNTYYLNELSGDNVLQSYSQNSYKEFSFLNDYLDKTVDVIVQLGNPRNSGTTLSWRVLPLEVIGEHTTDDTDKVNGIKDEPFAKAQTLYFKSGEQELMKASKQLEGAAFTYRINDESAASLEEKTDSYLLKINGSRSFKVTCTIAYKGVTASVTQDFEVKTKPENFQANKIEDLRTSAKNEDKVSLEAVVLGGVFDNGSDGHRFNSYYVMDETGTMQVTLTSDMAGKVLLSKGEKVYLNGTFDIYYKAANSKKVISASVEYVEEGEHDFPYSIPTKTFDEMYNYQVDMDNNRSGDVFYLLGILKKKDTKYGGTQYYIYAPDTTDFEFQGTHSKNIYHSSNADFSYLEKHLDTKATFLFGIHDKKAVTNGEPETGGYYRYDLVDGFYTPVSE